MPMIRGNVQWHAWLLSQELVLDVVLQSEYEVHHCAAGVRCCPSANAVEHTLQCWCIRLSMMVQNVQAGDMYAQLLCISSMHLCQEAP